MGNDILKQKVKQILDKIVVRDIVSSDDTLQFISQDTGELERLTVDQLIAELQRALMLEIDAYPEKNCKDILQEGLNMLVMWERTIVSANEHEQQQYTKVLRRLSTHLVSYALEREGTTPTEGAVIYGRFGEGNNQKK